MSDDGVNDSNIAVGERVRRKRTIADLPPAKEEAAPHYGRRFWVGALVGGLGVAAFAYSFVASASANPQADAGLRKALETRLPKTKVDKVNCNVVPGLCEVTAGSTLFYTDTKARFLVIGRVYDMETRADVTAARMLELQPDMLLAGAPRAEGAQKPAASQDRRESVSHVDLSALGPKGAINWGPKSGTKVTLFSDLRCSYCHKLVGELKSLGFRVEERPISVLGTRKLSEAVYCAVDQQKALEAAYAGLSDPVPQRAGCNPADLDENEAFAQRNGFNGTPVVVRSDGAVTVGYRPAAQLLAWAKAAQKAQG